MQIQCSLGLGRDSTKKCGEPTERVFEKKEMMHFLILRCFYWELNEIELQPPKECSPIHNTWEE